VCAVEFLPEQGLVIVVGLEVVEASYLAISVMMLDALSGLQTPGLVGPVVGDCSGFVTRDDANRAPKLWGAHFADSPRLANYLPLVQVTVFVLHHCRPESLYGTQKAQR